MKLVLSGIASIAFAVAAALPAVSHAADGTITITGKVGAQTCKINGNGSGKADFTVPLPKVSRTALASGGATAGRTPFKIELTNCSVKAGEDTKVFTHFEHGATVNSSTGNLTIAAGGADNVEVGLLNGDSSQIKLGMANENSHSVVLDATGAATLPYYAQYVATGGAAGAGTVNTSVMYSINYP